jgi:predicted transcriptional regulator
MDILTRPQVLTLQLSRMRRSKLTTLIFVLNNLSYNGPKNFHQIALKTEINEGELEKALIFLVKNKLIKKENSEVANFKITDKGFKILRFFEMDKNALES